MNKFLHIFDIHNFKEIKKTNKRSFQECSVCRKRRIVELMKIGQENKKT